jgi:hypothetical protein
LRERPSEAEAQSLRIAGSDFVLNNKQRRTHVLYEQPRDGSLAREGLDTAEGGRENITIVYIPWVKRNP